MKFVNNSFTLNGKEMTNKELLKRMKMLYKTIIKYFLKKLLHAIRNLMTIHSKLNKSKCFLKYLNKFQRIATKLLSKTLLYFSKNVVYFTKYAI
jgi:archaellum biogenesis ATPase FlaH